MRDAIAHILCWVLPLSPPRTLRRTPGRHSAEYLKAVTIIPPTLHTARPWSGPSSQDARAVFRADVSSLTPEQRERRWAIAFSDIGFDYPYGYAGDHFATKAAAAAWSRAPRPAALGPAGARLVPLRDFRLNSTPVRTDPKVPNQVVPRDPVTRFAGSSRTGYRPPLARLYPVVRPRPNAGLAVSRSTVTGRFINSSCVIARSSLVTNSPPTDHGSSNAAPHQSDAAGRP